MLSARLALSTEEHQFLIRVAAGLPQTEAYRRAFESQLKRDGKMDDKPYHAKQASNLLKQEYMQRALAELEGNAQEMAAQAYRDQMVIGKGNAVLGAAKQILEYEALQASKDDQERFWLIAAACGAVVRTRVGDEEVVVPLRDLMPKFKDAVPPQEVQRKTAAALEDWYKKLEERSRELDEREKELTRVD